MTMTLGDVIPSEQQPRRRRAKKVNSKRNGKSSKAIAKGKRRTRRKAKKS